MNKQKLMHKNALKVKNQIAWEDGFTFTYFSNFKQ